MVKKMFPFFGTLPFLRMSSGAIRTVVGLVGEDVPVGQKQNPGSAGGFAAQVPAAVEEFPGDLERNERLPGAGGKRQEDALPVLCNGNHRPLDGDVLIIAPRMATALPYAVAIALGSLSSFP